MKKYRIAIAIANIPLFIVFALYIFSSDFREVVNHQSGSRSKRYVVVNKKSTSGYNLEINIKGIGYTVGK
jgi:hypothetical protein